MLQNYREARTITAASMVEMTGDTGETKQVQAAYMTASLNSDGSFNITKTISNNAAYAEHRADVRKDFTNFEARVYEAEDGGIES